MRKLFVCSFDCKPLNNISYVKTHNINVLQITNVIIYNIFVLLYALVKPLILSFES